jgi:hypothetical protein
MNKNIIADDKEFSYFGKFFSENVFLLWSVESCNVGIE